MTKISVLLPLLLALPARAWEPDPVRAADVAVLVPALALTWVDVWQSTDMRRNPRLRMEEGDPLVSAVFGRNPLDWQFVAAGAASTILQVTIWYMLPERLRWLGPTLMLLAEGYTVYHNFQNGLTLRF